MKKLITLSLLSIALFGCTKASIADTETNNRPELISTFDNDCKLYSDNRTLRIVYVVICDNPNKSASVSVSQ